MSPICSCGATLNREEEVLIHGLGGHELVENPIKKLAQLSKEEDAVWVAAFEFHKRNGVSEEVADRRAWAETCEQFPRLLKYSGAKP